MSTQYSSIQKLIGVKPSWIPAPDLERISAYAIYEDIYWNREEVFKLMMRGTNDNPVYIPSAKIIIEATNRFLAKDFKVVLDTNIGTDSARAMVQAQLDRLFRREDFYAKFQTQRRYGLIRGDSMWHVVADPTKPPGSRISLYELDPATYFPIYEDDDLDRRVGCHIVDVVEYEDRDVIRRQTYRKVEGGVTTELCLFEMAKWDDRPLGHPEIKLLKVLVPEQMLPGQITQLPVYHIKNTRTPGDPYGSSELRGMETLFASINQSASDADMSLALDGIGMYATTSGPPVDEDGEETNWRLGPGRVVEHDQETDFERITGVATLTPFKENIELLMNAAQQSAGVPQVAIGKVDVTVAESGIALALELAPVLAKNAEKETEMLGIYNHMMYDLIHMWLPAYEDMPVFDVEAFCTVADPMPRNRKADVTEVMEMVAAGIISIRTAHVRLAELGWDIPSDEFNQILEETIARNMTAPVDPFAARLDKELNGGGNDDDEDTGTE